MIKVIKDKPPTLKEAQAFVGGSVQLLELSDGRQMLIDEEGKLKRKRRNMEATLMAVDILSERDYIVGPALILEGKAKWK